MIDPSNTSKIQVLTPERLFSLRGKTALVTGASGGIGRVLAATLAGAGASVGLHGSNPDRLEQSRRLLEGTEGSHAVFVVDLRGVAACRKLIDDAVGTLGRLDILVNCAGINRRMPIDRVTEDDFDAILDVNLRSLYFLSQAAHRVMKTAGGGTILNVGSMTSYEGLGEVSVYGATKAAVLQLTRTMALEWASDNVRVNCLAPGFMMTPLTENNPWGDEHKKRWLLDRIAMRRPGKPEELAGVALLLVSDASSYITGQSFAVDGGYLAGGSWLREDPD